MDQTKERKKLTWAVVWNIFFFIAVLLGTSAGVRLWLLGSSVDPALSYLLDATLERWDGNDSDWIRDYTKKVEGQSDVLRMVRSLREVSLKCSR